VRGRPLRILVVGPLFHGYTAVVGDALRRRGHDVAVHHYDDHGSTWGKARTKLVYELPERAGTDVGRRAQQRAATSRALAVLGDARPDLVLAIKADVLGPAFWESARAVGARSHLWLYDELRRMRHDPAVLAGVDLLTSYSRADVATLAAQGLPVTHLENAFDSHLEFTAAPSGDVLFLGARYPNREQLLLALHERGLPVRAVGRDWSHHVRDRARTWGSRRPPLPAGPDVPREQAYGLMAGAAANVNIHHNQDGFTMRTFEICGVGGLQLVDRADVDAVYEPGTEVLVFGSPDEAAEHVAHALADPRWADRVRERARAHTLSAHTFDHRAVELEALWA
jgi:spore maturation protein CgeB